METLLGAIQAMEKNGYEIAALVQAPGSISNSPRIVCSRTLNARLQTTLWEIYEAHQQQRQESQNKADATLDTEVPVLELDLRNAYAVENYLKNVFSMLRQLQCKAIAKAWIKVVEPRKKARYPYIKGELFKPYWWPPNVEHKEPDHLRKPQRIMLMIAILTRLIPHCNDPNLLLKLKKSTMSIHFPKNFSHHQIALDYVYNICGALCSGLTTVAAVDCNLLQTVKAGSKKHKTIKMDPALERLTLLGTISPVSLDGAESRPGSGSFQSLIQSFHEGQPIKNEPCVNIQPGSRSYSSDASLMKSSSMRAQSCVSSASNECLSADHFSDLDHDFVRFCESKSSFEY
ncbi:LAFA_0E05204g1_1 [Lachancea sp. 'fantastica']|nr:LAFA_0E05204g1_1 [Lachancea sp. 'fantastica']